MGPARLTPALAGKMAFKCLCVCVCVSESMVPQTV